jgi:hypothetical protein
LSFLYDGTSGEVELYDLREDPDEQTDVKADHPETVARFEDRLDARLAQIEQTSADITIPDRSTDAGVEERLKALGYRD